MNKQIEEKDQGICKSCIHYNVCWQCDENTLACSHYKDEKEYRKVSQEGAECPTCHGTGRIGTTDWLTKNISKEQLAKEKAEAIAEHEAQIKRDVAREIFAEIDKRFEALLKFYPCNGEFEDAKRFVDFHWKHIRHSITCDYDDELKKKYESEGEDDE